MTTNLRKITVSGVRGKFSFKCCSSGAHSVGVRG